MEENLTYEYFIRRCWHCDRFKHGANTDTWEDLVIKHYNLQHAHVGNFKVAQQEFNKKLVEVKSYINKAFDKLINNAGKSKLNAGIIEELLQSQKTIIKSVEPKEIIGILSTTFPIINNHNL